MGSVVALNGGYRLVDATAFADEPDPERRWVIPGLLERHGRILMVGAEGSGKSLLAITLAVQAAAGKEVLGRFEMDWPMRTVFMDLEMGPSSQRRRLRPLRISAGLQPDSLFLLRAEEGIDSASQRETRQITAVLKDFAPDLVIVDPLYKLTNTDSTYERESKPVLRFLDHIRSEFDCGLILIHHLRKRGQGEATRGKDASDIYGSSVWLRWPESLFIMREDTLVVEKDRDQIIPKGTTFPIKRGGQWPISLLDPNEPPDELIYQALVEAGPMSRSQIQKQVHRRTQTVSDAINRLAVQGRISQNGSDRWRAQ